MAAKANISHIKSQAPRGIAMAMGVTALDALDQGKED
jgi:hypothetical protein